MPPFDRSARAARPAPAARLTALVAGLLSSLCVACAPWSPAPLPAPRPEPPQAASAPSAPPAPDVAQAARTWSAIQDRIASTPPDQWPLHAAALGDGRATPEQSLELALLLGLLQAPGDTARALDLLQGVLQRTDPEALAWRHPALLLKALLSEQRRLQEQAERLNAQLRDQQRDSQRRIDQLNEKLEALKSIERSLNQRGAPAAPANRP